ncbi:acyltransferase [Novosphingobium sp.]|uniref:acyltransferase family protein n=1 Tax=Novosphingobium sp. TaxID=1874826 RepID=UPI0025FCF937|nr:acyltransferase [Novosphingobium sp.]
MTGQSGTGPIAPATGHLAALTGIRGIAAWGVVLYHCRLSLATILPAAAIDVLAKGYLAVDLFFMLSGFVIWYNYAPRLAAQGASAVLPFLWRRFARVWPLHGAILALFGALAVLLIATGRPIDGYPLGELPLHALLVQNWGFTGALSWNHPAWSISTEFGAYLLFPLLVAVGAVQRLRTALLPVIAGLGLLLLWGLYASAGHRTLGADITGLGLWRCLIQFSIGAVLCELYRRPSGAARQSLACGIMAAVICMSGITLGWAETAFVPAVLVLALFALATGRGTLIGVLASRPLVYLGEVSYATYLSHFLLFIVFKIAFVGANLQVGWTGLFGYVAMVLTASVLLYHGLEKPAQRWLNRHPPRWARDSAKTPSAKSHPIPVTPAALP